MTKNSHLYQSLCTFLLAAICIFSAPNALAQTTSGQNGGNAFANLFGAIAQSAAKANAQQSWTTLTPEIKNCVNVAYAPKNITVAALVASGIAATDQRLAPVMAFCTNTMKRQLQVNFPCMATSSRGQPVQTTCTEVYAEEVGGIFRPINQDDFIRASIAGLKVTISRIEIPSSKTNRLEIAKNYAIEDIHKNKNAYEKSFDEYIDCAIIYEFLYLANNEMSDKEYSNSWISTSSDISDALDLPKQSTLSIYNKRKILLDQEFSKIPNNSDLVAELKSNSQSCINQTKFDKNIFDILSYQLNVYEKHAR